MSLGYPAPPVAGTVVFTSTLGVVSWETSAAGVTDHDALGAASLVWTSSAHTGTASRIAAFNGAGAASYLQVGVDVQAYSANLAAMAALAVTDGNFIVANGATWVAESGATARTSLGLGSLATLSTINGSNWSGTDLAVADGGTGSSTAAAARTALGVAIGSNVQAWDANLDQIAALAVTDSNFLVGNGSAWVAESGATVRTSLGLGSLATQNANAVAITGGSVNGVSGSGITIWTVDSLTLNGTSITSSTSMKLTAAATWDLTLDFGDDLIIQGDAGSDCNLRSCSLTVNDTTPERKFSVTDTQSATGCALMRNTNSGAGADVLWLDLSAVAAANTGNAYVIFDDAGGIVGSITGNGVGVNYNTTSDGRLKGHQRASRMDGLALVQAMQVRDFEWTFRGHAPDTGLIAQELHKVYPKAVSIPDAEKALGRRVVKGRTRGRLDPETGVHEAGEPRETLCDVADLESVLQHFTDGAVVSVPGPGERGFLPWSVDYGKLVVPLIKAVQEQQVMIAELRARLAALERR